MRKLHKAAVVGAVLGSVGALSAGSAYAHGEPGHDIKQGTSCRSHDMNISVLGALGAFNGLAGNALNGEGSPGAQPANLGSKMSCDNHAF
ncbi:hypothetical protein SSP35_09_00380 [Streptomyces sp. NBRC 110611]|uniref:hypothetical protein n=1 Tax=Streptomyces sp. NBRC 110611 TaxID=1621259 RepID=UPI00082F2C2F|nr:hypothetical protein [Streptomyces sp. NBRC 110611]GAU68795.1 hypothetical protein SSP35_09_00380 [Streptomyces sp. NBRC 110611]